MHECLGVAGTDPDACRGDVVGVGGESVQSPSMLGPDAVPFDQLYSDALDYEEAGVISTSYG
ncbi:MAG: hypothetical protein II626_03070, partial [Prevotella sp.]|nr:hypothetical protein [Prevotella sp.]